MFDFSFNTHYYFPESGSFSIFYEFFNIGQFFNFLRIIRFRISAQSVIIVYLRVIINVACQIRLEFVHPLGFMYNAHKSNASFVKSILNTAKFLGLFSTECTTRSTNCHNKNWALIEDLARLNYEFLKEENHLYKKFSSYHMGLID
jgi:hypothetical protein